jgi:Tfp pilus assembly protein PilO
VPTHNQARKRLAVDRQQYLILLVAAVMVGSFFLLVLWPRQRELSDLGTAVTRQREQVSQKVRLSHEGIYVSARIAALRTYQQQLANRLPDEPRLAEFLRAVAARVQAEPGVTHEIQRTEAQAGAQAPAVPMRLRLAGPYEGVHRCLAAIEDLERLNRFRRVHIQRTDDGGRVVVEAEIFVYYLPPEVVAPAQGQTRAAVREEPQAVRG